MSFAELLVKRFGIKNATEGEVYAEFMSTLTDEDKATIESRNTVFERLSSDFDVEFGKVSPYLILAVAVLLTLEKCSFLNRTRANVKEMRRGCESLT